jgi:hypothetical protein
LSKKEQAEVAILESRSENHWMLQSRHLWEVATVVPV